MNGDGFGDIIFSNPLANEESGVAVVVFGTDVMSEVSALSITAILAGNTTQGFAIYGTADSMLGVNVSTAGDFNGDGYDDILVGAIYANHYVGAAYVIFGKPLSSGEVFDNIDLSVGLSAGVGITLSGYANDDQTG